MNNTTHLHYVIAIALVFFTGQAFAGSITGSVADVDGIALGTANVILLSEDDKTLIKSALTEEDGTFVLSDIADGNYLLKITMLGYTEYSKAGVTIKGVNVDMGKLVLERSTTTLKQVSVRAQKPLIEVKADRLIVNVENSIVSSGSSALEVLARSPNVNVDQDDNISIKGRQGVTVMIDGRPMAISGTDLANMLKSMPSSTIEKIEIISNPGAKYDAAGVGGIINIKTKRTKKAGVSGSANTSIAQGVYPKYDVGANLNYRNKKVSAYTSYNYADRGWFNNLILDRRFLDSSDQLLGSYKQNNFSKMYFKSHSLTLGGDYALTNKTTIGAVLTGSYFGFDPKVNNNSTYLDGNDDVVYYFNTKGEHQNSFYNYTTNLNLRHRFDSTGKELTVDLDYARYWSDVTQNFVTSYSYADGITNVPDYHMMSDLAGLTQIRSLKADYTQPLKGNAKFEAGIKSSYVTSDNEPLFYERTTGDFVLDTKRSNHFLYKENINAVYVNTNKDWKKWSTQVGLRMENTNVVADQITLDSTYEWSYTQLFPSLAVQRHLNAKHDLGISLSRRIQRPNYQQLNPFKYFVDNTTYREGYPYLRPALTYSVEATHTFMRMFVTSFTYSITNDQIVQVIQPSETDTGRVTVQTNKNLTSMRYYALSGAYPYQITKWWNTMLNANLYYAHYKGNIANTNLSKGTLAYTLSSTNRFMLPKNFSAEVSAWYQSKQVYGYMDLKSMWMLNAGVQKTLMNNKATLKLNVQDAFWKGYPRATSTYEQYVEDFTARRTSRQVTLSFAYRFGNNKMQSARKRRGGAEDEKSRVGNGGGA